MNTSIFTKIKEIKIALIGFLSSIILAGACFHFPEENYQKHGVQFTKPTDWKISGHAEYWDMGG